MSVRLSAAVGKAGVGLPALTAAGLGRVRVTIGCGILLIVGSEEPDALPRAFHRNYSILADNALVHWLASDETAWRALLWLATGAAVFFTIGLCSRIAYTMLVAAILLTRLAMLQSHGIHDWVAP